MLSTNNLVSNIRCCVRNQQYAFIFAETILSRRDSTHRVAGYDVAWINTRNSDESVGSTVHDHNTEKISTYLCRHRTHGKPPTMAETAIAEVFQEHNCPAEECCIRISTPAGAPYPKWLGPE